jgi:hypothetical protein
LSSDLSLPPAPARAHARRLCALAATATAALALALTGCGSGAPAGGTEADPATAVPAAAPFYLAATVRPTGATATGALAAGRALTGQADPFTRLLGTLRTPGSPPLDFHHDVAPWLGPGAGLFVDATSAAGPLLSLVQQALTGSGQTAAIPFGPKGVDGALVLDTSDASAARSFLAGQAKRAGAHAARYRGVAYEVTPAHLALGLVGRFAVIGSEAGLRGVIGVTQGEAPLSGAPGYSKLTAAAPAGALARLYAKPAAGQSSEASGLVGLLTGGRQAEASLVASAGTVALDLDTLPGGSETGAGLLGADPQAAAALAALPGESWLGIGLGHVGANLPSDVAGLRALGSLLGAGSSEAGATLSLGSVLSALTAPLAILGARDARSRREFSSWMGSAGIFAAGSSALELKAGVVISSSDAARSRAAVAALASRLRSSGTAVSRRSIPGSEAAASARLNGLPLELDIAAGRGADGQAKFVLGLGEASVQTALAPSATLATSAARSAAASALGEGVQPSLTLDFPTLLSLLEGIGLSEDPTIKPALPYLRASSTLAGGGQTLEGGIERFRLVLGLHEEAAEDPEAE